MFHAVHIYHVISFLCIPEENKDRTYLEHSMFIQIRFNQLPKTKPLQMVNYYKIFLCAERKKILAFIPTLTKKLVGDKQCF